MTRVEYIPGKAIDITGHAGAGVKGEDIVCAGVSALTNALLLAAADNQELLLASMLRDEQAAHIRVCVKPTSRRGKELARDILQTVYRGLQALGRMYPAHVRCIETEEEN